MRYRAKYGEAGYEAALKDAASFLETDGYYSKYPFHTEAGPAGTGLVWYDFNAGSYFVRLGDLSPQAGSRVTLPRDPEEAFLLEIVQTHQTVAWTSRTGNQVRYDFQHDKRTVVLEMSGRRHGVPSRALKRLEPLEVLEYETQAPELGPWETRT
jgi:hypothetical protein